VCCEVGCRDAVLPRWLGSHWLRLPRRAIVKSESETVNPRSPPSFTDAISTACSNQIAFNDRALHHQESYSKIFSKHHIVPSRQCTLHLSAEGQ
jgi:hypothetical protein